MCSANEGNACLIRPRHHQSLRQSKTPMSLSTSFKCLGSGLVSTDSSTRGWLRDLFELLWVTASPFPLSSGEIHDPWLRAGKDAWSRSIAMKDGPPSVSCTPTRYIAAWFSCTTWSSTIVLGSLLSKKTLSLWWISFQNGTAFFLYLRINLAKSPNKRNEIFGDLNEPPRVAIKFALVRRYMGIDETSHLKLSAISGQLILWYVPSLSSIQSSLCLG